MLGQAREGRLLSDEHFSVDGTLLEAWASMKSFRPKDGGGRSGGGGRNAEADFHGEKRSNATHQSSTDPQARLYRKGQGQEAKLCYLGHALMDNRHGLIVDTRTTEAGGRAEREAGLAMMAARPGTDRLTLGADKGYDTKDFVEGLRCANVSPHVAQNDTHRRSAIDRRTTRHRGYAVSQRIRKRIEEGFGWAKTIGGMRKLKHRGLAKVDFQFTLTFAVYNLVPTAHPGSRRLSMCPWPPCVCATLAGLKWPAKQVQLDALKPGFPSIHSQTLKYRRFSTAC